VSAWEIFKLKAYLAAACLQASTLLMKDEYLLDEWKKVFDFLERQMR